MINWFSSKTKVLCLGIVFSACVMTGPATAAQIYTFTGNADLKNETMHVKLDLGENASVVAEVSRVSGEEYRLGVKLDNLKTNHFLLSSEIESFLEKLPNKKGLQQFISARIKSQYSLLNHKPVQELSGRFEITDNQLVVKYLSFARVVIDGKLSLAEPFDIRMSLELDEIDLDDFLNFWVKNKTYDSNGPVTGTIELSGNLKNLQMKGDLETIDGYIKNLQFQSIRLHAQGVYPHIQISNSSLTKIDGYTYALGGGIDLSDQENFKRQIKALDISPLVSGNDIEREWTIKRFQHEDKSATELKYLLRKDNQIGSIDDDSAMFGVERSLEF